MLDSKENLDILTRLKNEAQAKERKLQKLIEEAARSAKITDDLLQFYKKKWAAHLLKLLENNSDFFTKIRNDQPELAKALDTIFSEAEIKIKDELKRFPILFEKYCREAGIDIDPLSRHPKYRVCEKFIDVEVIEASLQVKIKDRENNLGLIPCDVEAVIESLIFHKKRLFDRKFDPNEFLKRLFNQYKKISEKEKFPFGYPIPIRKITHRLGKNVKGFRTDEFLIDLSRLVRQGHVKVDDYVLHLEHTKRDAQGMLLHKLEEIGYVGFISFRKEG